MSTLPQLSERIRRMNQFDRCFSFSLNAMQEAMLNAILNHIQPDLVTEYWIKRDTSELTFREVLGLWASDAPFRSFFITLLADSPFSAYRWETPVLTNDTAEAPFRFVLVNTPSFASRRTDSTTFRDYFTTDPSDDGVVSFANLSGDATLFIPSPRVGSTASGNATYGHLAAFIRGAPPSQVQSLWQLIGSTVSDRLSQTPLWLSTAGDGVAWLHVRLDSKPKYYFHQPYKRTT